MLHMYHMHGDRPLLFLLAMSYAFFFASMFGHNNLPQTFTRNVATCVLPIQSFMKLVYIGNHVRCLLVFESRDLGMIVWVIPDP